MAGVSYSLAYNGNSVFLLLYFQYFAKILQPQLIRAEPNKSFALGSTRQKNS